MDQTASFPPSEPTPVQIASTADTTTSTPVNPQTPQSATLTKPEGKGKVKLIMISILGALVLFFLLGVGGALAYVAKNPTKLLTASDAIANPLLNLLNSNSLTRTPKSMIAASIRQAQTLKSFTQETEASISLKNAAGKNLSAITIKLQSPMKILSEKDKGNFLDSKAKFLLELVYDDVTLRQETEAYAPGYGDLIPSSPAVVGGEIITLGQTMYLLLEKLPTIPLLNFQPLLNQWWRVENYLNAKDVEDIKKQSDQAEANYATMRDQFHQLVSGATLKKLEEETIDGHRLYVTSVQFNKTDLKPLLITLFKPGDGFYETSAGAEEIEKVVSTILDHLGDPGSTTLNFSYAMDMTTKYPAWINFESKFSDLTKIRQVYIPTTVPQVLGAKYTQSYPESVVFTIKIKFSDYNKPVLIQTPASSKPYEGIPWEEITRPLMLMDFSQSYYPEPLIDPEEQLKKANDVGTRFDAIELLSALERYNANHFQYPWGLVRPSAQCPLLKDGPQMCDLPAGMVDINVLVEEAELKSSFSEHSLNKLFVTQDPTDKVHVCFLPESDAYKNTAQESFNEKGESWVSGPRYDCLP